MRVAIMCFVMLLGTLSHADELPFGKRYDCSLETTLRSGEPKTQKASFPAVGNQGSLKLGDLYADVNTSPGCSGQIEVTMTDMGSGMQAHASFPVGATYLQVDLGLYYPYVNNEKPDVQTGQFVCYLVPGPSN